MKVIVVGGGIGGLTTALALLRHGIEPIVLERTPQLTEVGAGVQIAANGTIVLRELGLEPALASIATVPERFDYLELSTGRLLYVAPLGKEAEARYGALLYNVHRADLIDLLAKAVPPHVIRLGAECASVSQDDEGAWVTLQNGEVIRGDAVIGADGIHSAVRTALRGPEEKQFANILMWRSLIPADRLTGLKLPVAGNNWFGVGRNIVSYWVRKDLYSILASVPATEVSRESWTQSGDVAQLRRSFEGSEPTVQKMLDAVDSTFITGMYHRDPIEQWSTGRIALLGDAAHAMVPYLAQGACQAIEDAWVLATCLKNHGRGGVQDALLEYERRRQPRTTRIQAGARFVVDWAHEPDEARVRQRNGRLKGLSRIDPLAEASWSFAWGHNILEAARLPPGEVVGLSAAREGKRMERPESQRAFDLWKGVFKPDDIARGDRGQRAAYERFLLEQFPAPASTEVADVDLHGVSALRVVAAGAGQTATVLHFHGGGYVLGSAKSSVEYASRLSRALNGPCYTVDYRLAPEHPYPAAFDDAFSAWRGLLASGVDPSTVFLSGESSGGGLALAIAAALRRAGLPLPAGVIAICPLTDLTLGGPSVMANSGDDPAANRETLSNLVASYFQGHEPTDPMVSPLFADLADLPPVFLSAVEGEVLESDTTRFAERAKAAGANVTLKMVADSVHVFTLFPFLAETAETLEEIGQWSRQLLQK
ncbi:alpha/beta hydrolase fold domain-containing protein [Paraburkholderia panacisoli]|uniref:Alpha/beta hydrolase fold domain-containing protein n=1 Tax=Paraburkholderia panacisoli TaxID=2603818 RepID=A0A5B0H8C7_9BURK|nr:alpha/beta hydrolase fold domain-containing protein [Paraburkholderia panacisoli]KAA1011381.1 alpha/beta hydrolase fold domain-containing protein [Paraburkholderia panacisoli]